MKIKVLVEFHDKYENAHIYNPGEIIEFEDSRAIAAISYGLCEEYRGDVPVSVEEPVKAEESVKETKPKKTTAKKKSV